MAKECNSEAQRMEGRTAVNAELADRLLAEVMQWSADDVAEERPLLQAMASYKYDEYQQFAPGMRFIESLAIWLRQFHGRDEQQTAYDFIKQYLIFCSDAEMKHLVEIAYHDHIRISLLRRVAETLNVEQWRVSKIRSSQEYQLARRRSLFIGLSDGARMDVFRRASRELSHEQILLIYDSVGNTDRIAGTIEELDKDISILIDEPTQGTKFNTLVLLDDFSGSGKSYIRQKKDGTYTGKLFKLCTALLEDGKLRRDLIDAGNLSIIVVLYIATEQARQYLQQQLSSLLFPYGVSFEIVVVQLLEESVAVHPGEIERLDGLLDAYYRTEYEDKHSEVGGTSIKYGFSEGGLPLVLSHNTPNNSIFVIWLDKLDFRGLFPRRSRHGAVI